jgi:hypothetical protein
VESVEAGFVKLAGGHLLNPTKDARRFDVGTRRHLEVAQSDQLLIRMNDKARGVKLKGVTSSKVSGLES